MKILLFFYLIIFCNFALGKEVKLPDPHLWVSQSNFEDFPLYVEKEYLLTLPEWLQCDPAECTEIEMEGKKYFYSFLVTNKNYKNLLIGTWTGDECSTDYWRMNADGDFQSAYPLEGKTYSWEGQFTLDSTSYIEKGINNSKKREHNEAWLYYVPKLEVLIYKGTKSLDSDTGEYIYYDDGYVYFKKCK